MPGTAPSTQKDPWQFSRGLRTLRIALASAVQKGGEAFVPPGESAPVRAVPQKLLREEFKAMYAPSSDPDPEKRRKAFEAAIRRALRQAHDHGLVRAQETESGQIVWEVEQSM